MAYSRTFAARSFEPLYSSRDPDAESTAPGEIGVTVLGTWAEGEEITFLTSELSFGDLKPEFVRRILLGGATAGEGYDPELGVNYEIGRLAGNGIKPVSNLIPVHEVVGMPYGKAFATGDVSTDPLQKAGVASTVSPLVCGTSKKFIQKFEHSYYYWPQAHQQNVIDDATALGGSGYTIFNIKRNWTGVEGRNYGASDVNVYNGLYRFNGFGSLGPSARVSNVASLGTAFPSGGSITYPGGGLVCSDPMCVQIANRLHASSGFDHLKVVANRADGGDPVLCNSTVNNNNVCLYPPNYPDETLRGQPFSNEFNEHRLFGFVRGYGVNWNYHYYTGDDFLQFGDGAFARVEIYDVDGSNRENRISVMTPVYHHPKEFVVRVVAGIFSGESLIGKNWRIFNAANSVVASGVCV